MVREIQEAQREDTLLLVEHPPVYTTGRGGKDANLAVSETYLRSLGADYLRIDRGGDITFHGPGQLVAYPVLDLRERSRDVVAYVRSLEQVVVDLLAEFGIRTERAQGKPGVWVEGERKICAIGVRISRGVTSHGLALNVSTDLSWFDNIVPCGLPGTHATSMSELLGDAPEMALVADRFVRHFGRVFGRAMAKQGEAVGVAA
jgi:lipoyl(octanoyl) transferase